jgi:hypothetical protein
MPKVPDVVCAGKCGRLLWSSKGSAPAGERVCWECRAIRRGGVVGDTYPVNKPPVTKHCVVCGFTFETCKPSQLYCSKYCNRRRNNVRRVTPPTPIQRSRSKVKDATTDRGLGWQHQKQRARLVARHVEGSLCWWCGEPMYRSQGLAADHSVARAKGGALADRLLHGPCNAQRGDGSRDHRRPALLLVPRTTREW